jgi:hypothetical protein
MTGGVLANILVIDTEQWVRQYKLERGIDPDEEDSEFDFFSRGMFCGIKVSATNCNRVGSGPVRELRKQKDVER